ncbi:Uncharacterized alpha/beta hydrolase domain (DUF2235) domain containing protein [Lactarius tabidus]
MTGPSYPLSPTSEDVYRKPRTLVLCFDGTSNEFSERNTNVVKLYSILKKDDPKSQLCYYQARIGTYFQPGVVSPFFRVAAQALDEMFAWYLSEHIIDGYKFLMQNYHEGDRICIFGFSRGAYTARALAGMLHKVGLLSKDNNEQVSFAYKLYKSSRRKDNKLAAQFKKVFSCDVPIEFLGVWDTVASVGILNGRTLPFVGTNDTVKWFRQALSLDERRAKFRPNLYHRPSVISKSGTRPSPRRSITRALGCTSVQDTPHDIHHNNLHDQDLKKPSESDTNRRILEVWFAGCHCDVGGGHVKDTEQHALSNISLRWMVREILKTGSHILFDETALNEWSTSMEMIKQAPGSELMRETLHTLQVTPTPLKTSDMPDLGKGSEGTATPDADALDAVQGIGDQLKKNAFWWIIEIIPTNYMWQNAQDEWVGGWSINSGRGRKVPSHPRPLFHESVRTRCQDPDLDYVPAARYERGIEEYVV